MLKWVQYPKTAGSEVNLATVKRRMFLYLRRMRWWLLPAVTWLMLGLPTLRWLWVQWWTNDFYSHGLLVMPLALYLGWRSRSPQGEGSNLALVGLVGGTGGYVVALASHAMYVAAFLWVGMAAFLVAALGGWQMLRRLWFPLVFVLLAVPLPFVEAASLPLSQWAGTVAASVVRLLGIPVLANGSQITLPNTHLVVGAQCSGLRSLIALITLGALFAYAAAGPLWCRWVVFLSAVPLALVGNLGRVVSLVVVAYLWGAERAFAFYHNYSGFVFFFLVFVGLVGIARGMGCRNVRDLF